MEMHIDRKEALNRYAENRVRAADIRRILEEVDREQAALEEVIIGPEPAPEPEPKREPAPPARLMPPAPAQKSGPAVQERRDAEDNQVFQALSQFPGPVNRMELSAKAKMSGDRVYNALIRLKAAKRVRQLAETGPNNTALYVVNK